MSNAAATEARRAKLLRAVLASEKPFSPATISDTTFLSKMARHKGLVLLHEDEKGGNRRFTITGAGKRWLRKYSEKQPDENYIPEDHHKHITVPVSDPSENTRL